MRTPPICLASRRQAGRQILCIAFCLLTILTTPWRVLAEDDYHTGRLDKGSPPSLPSRAVGILFQDDPNGPLRFSRDLYVMQNIYVADPTRTGTSKFQTDTRGDTIPLRTGFRNMRPEDVSRDLPRWALVDIQIDAGRGVQGLNGLLVTHCQRLDRNLPVVIAKLDGDVDRLAHSLDARIQPYFHQKQTGRDTREVEVTWLSDVHAIQVRFARSVSGRHLEASSNPRHGPRWMMWNVPYLTVLYRVQPDGRVISRVVVPPGDPAATARRYNPGGSPW